MPQRADRIAALLTGQFAPTLLRVTDESARHAGHAGATPEGETHYAVLLVSPTFRDQNRRAGGRIRQRLARPRPDAADAGRIQSYENLRDRQGNVRLKAAR